VQTFPRQADVSAFDSRAGSANSERKAAGRGLPLGDPLAKHVLLVEDEPNIAEAMSFLLSRDGWRVSHVADGNLVLDQLRRDPPDLVILDHMLPGLSGLEILTALRADPATRHLPVMMLTARGRDRDLAAEAGADRFMSKPFSNADLLAEVRAMMEG
jgi:DNA-binding response OmpR family regulator